jgi:hypothetical protein
MVGVLAVTGGRRLGAPDVEEADGRDEEELRIPDPESAPPDGDDACRSSPTATTRSMTAPREKRSEFSSCRC